MIKKCHKNLNIFLRSNEGSTMIETLVSFVVLMIVIAALYGMVRFSSNLRMRAIDTANVRSEFNSQIYNNNPGTTIESYYYIGENTKNDSERTPMFYLMVDTSTGATSSKNLDTSSTSDEVSESIKSQFAESSKKKAIKLNDINAVGYVSTDSRITDENLVPPKVLVFEYDNTPANVPTPTPAPPSGG